MSNEKTKISVADAKKKTLQPPLPLQGERVGERGFGKPRLDDCDSAIDDWAADTGCLHLFALLDGFTLSVATRANLRKELQLYLRLRDRLKGLEALPFSRERESERRNTCVRMAAIKDGMVRYLCSFARNEYDSATRFLNAVFGKNNWRNPIYCFIGDESLG